MEHFLSCHVNWWKLDNLLRIAKFALAVAAARQNEFLDFILRIRKPTHPRRCGVSKTDLCHIILSIYILIRKQDVTQWLTYSANVDLLHQIILFAFHSPKKPNLNIKHKTGHIKNFSTYHQPQPIRMQLYLSKKFTLSIVKICQTVVLCKAPWMRQYVIQMWKPPDRKSPFENPS